MKKSVISTLLAELERLVQVELESGVEFWLARDLQTVLGYTNWQNFRKVIGDAVTACESSGNKASDQFIEVSKLISHGKGGQRAIQDFMLTRHSASAAMPWPVNASSPTSTSKTTPMFAAFWVNEIFFRNNFHRQKISKRLNAA